MTKLPSNVPADQRRAAIEPWITEIIARARMFVDRFHRTEWFWKENLHEFIGLEILDKQGELAVRYNCTLMCTREGDLHIGHLREPTKDGFQLDELYPVRKVIAEAALPEAAQENPPDYNTR